MGAGPGRTPVSPSPRVFAKPGGADEGAEGAGVCTGVPGGARTPQPLQPGSATGANGPSSGASGRHMPPVLMPCAPPARQPVGAWLDRRARAAARSAEMQRVYLFSSILYPAVGLFVLRPSAKWEERVTSALRGVLVEKGDLHARGPVPKRGHQLMRAAAGAAAPCIPSWVSVWPPRHRDGRGSFLCSCFTRCACACVCACTRVCCRSGENIE